MKAFVLLISVCVTASSVGADLRCRRCIGAASLDECTFSIPCSSDEICYMDMGVTDQLSVEYNGGCRPRDVCQKSAAVVGKRGMSYIACSGCCDTQASPECNTKICGIKSSMAGISQCYDCASNGGQFGAVNDPQKCKTLSSCQSDQMCAAETFALGGSKTYEFKCLSKRICSLLTVQALKSLDACRNNPIMCGNVGRRASGTKICTTCCGDSQCNSESCHDIIDGSAPDQWEPSVLSLNCLKNVYGFSKASYRVKSAASTFSDKSPCTDRLYNLWKGGVLDLNTLTVNGTMPATRPAINTTPGSFTTI